VNYEFWNKYGTNKDKKAGSADSGNSQQERSLGGSKEAVSEDLPAEAAQEFEDIDNLQEKNSHNS